MISDKIIVGLLAVYAVLAVVCLFEKNYVRSLYWFASVLITVSVLWGMK